MFAHLHHNRFSTYLRNYSGTSKLLTWNDGCGYQNKSAAIANSVQKFLTPGHTQMDCGAMHSLVERKIKCDIFTPRDDLGIAMAREAPFTVTEVYYKKPKILSGDFFYPFHLERKVNTYRYALNNDRTPEVSHKLNWRDEWIALPCTVDFALC
ncbi:hypothetical protein PoB_003187800 [Plakobranchus ocellatus]|uniref:Uncharacterized protein n=1 Tax=Plakobranchus ocellatus TaxID=259542 RepID=A0AAV4AEZ1_9GAST|nr:hypothetical protein PoB_003187800 [Plakobranchus ocellatus]